MNQLTKVFEGQEVRMLEENGHTIYDRKWMGLGRDFLLRTFGMEVAL